MLVGHLPAPTRGFTQPSFAPLTPPPFRHHTHTQPFAELEKRVQAWAEKKKKLENPSYFVSTTRLSFRNLPLTIDEKRLREDVIRAAKGTGPFGIVVNRLLLLWASIVPLTLLRVRHSRGLSR